MLSPLSVRLNLTWYKALSRPTNLPTSQSRLCMPCSIEMLQKTPGELVLAPSGHLLNTLEPILNNWISRQRMDVPLSQVIRRKSLMGEV